MDVKRFITALLGVLALAVYQRDELMFRYVDAADRLTKNVFKLGQARDMLMKSVDQLNPLKGRLLESVYPLPQIDLTLDYEDLRSFDEAVDEAMSTSGYTVYMPAEANTAVNANLNFKGLEYKAEVKLHGTHPSHFSEAKKSYSVKIRKKESKTYPDGMRRFALIIPSQSNLISMFTYEVAGRLGLLTPNNYLVRLSINGISQGVYHLEEKLGKTMLERNGMAGTDVVRADDSWAHQNQDNHGTDYSFFPSGLKFKQESGQELGQRKLFSEVLTSSSYDNLKHRIVEADFYRYDTLRYLFGDNGKMTSHDNIKLLYSTSSGRISPYFRIENLIDKIRYDGKFFSPERFINQGIFTRNPLLTALVLDDGYRLNRNAFMYNYLTTEGDNLVRLLREYTSRLNPLSIDISNSRPTRFFAYELNRSIKNLEDNLENLKKYLTYSRVFLSLEFTPSTGGSVLHIAADSNSGVRPEQILLICSTCSKDTKVEAAFEGTEFTLSFELQHSGDYVANLADALEAEVFHNGMNNEFEPVPKPREVVIRSSERLLLEAASFRSIVSGDKLPDRDVYVANYSNASLTARVPEEWLGQSEIRMAKGVHKLPCDVMTPVGATLLIEAGAHIYLQPLCSLLVRGGLRISGVSDDPVVVTSLAEEPFGVFAVVGDGETTVEISHLNISNGFEARLENQYFSGALSIYNHKYVEISTSAIFRNRADDGLNIKQAEVRLQKIGFSKISLIKSISTPAGA